MFVTADEVDLLTEALARAASRHEIEARARATSAEETVQRHFTTAKAMRALRNRIIAQLEKKELSEILLRT